jgi:choline kinase
MANKLTILIPAAGPGRRMRSYGPKALIKLDDNLTLIQRQLHLLRNTFPLAEIVVIVGFEADKICKELPRYVHTVYNDAYEDTNVAHSLMLGLSTVSKGSILVVYGDLVFNREALPKSFEQSTAIIDSKNQMDRNEVGVTIVNNEVTRFSYGLPTKWAQIVYLHGLELEIFKKVISDKRRSKFFGFEILNHMLDNGGNLQALEPNDMQIAEIDTSKDIEIAKRIQ